MGVSADLHHLISIIGKKNKILQHINIQIILASLQLCYILLHDITKSTKSDIPPHPALISQILGKG